jgi:hypothetical protein
MNNHSPKGLSYIYLCANFIPLAVWLSAITAYIQAIYGGGARLARIRGAGQSLAPTKRVIERGSRIFNTTCCWESVQSPYQSDV